MDIIPAIKAEIKEENLDDEVSITFHHPPITVGGSDYPIVQIKEESEDLPDLIVEHTVSSPSDLNETVEEHINSVVPAAETWNFLSTMERPRREPRPKVFYDELYGEPIKKKSSVHQSFYSDSDATLSCSDEAGAEPKRAKKSRGPDPDAISDRSTSIASKPRKRIRKPGPLSKTSHFELDQSEFHNYSSIFKKIRQKRSLPANMESDETIQIAVSSSKTFRSSYTKRVPDDYYRALFKIKPSYVAVHNVIQLFQTKPVQIIGINMGECTTCQKLRAFTTVDLRGTGNRAKTSKTLELTLKPLPPSEMVSVRADESNNVSGYFINKSGYVHFIEQVNEVFFSTLPAQLHTTLKVLLPPEFNWKSFMPDCLPVSPETQKRFLETLIDIGNEQDLSPMFVQNQSLLEAKKKDNGLTSRKLRCCLTCSQVFRNEITHKCPGIVAAVKSPTPAASLLEVPSTNVLDLPGVTITPGRISSKKQSIVKCLHCGLNVNAARPHNCSSKLRRRLPGQVTLSNNNPQCAKNKTLPKCPTCSLTLIAGGLHTCGKVVQVSEPLSPPLPMETELPANSDNILDQVFTCMICSKSYKYEFSLKKHACIAIENTCKMCLKPCKENDGHSCPGSAKCSKCSVVVKPDQYSCHVCKIIKHCSYCKKTIKGITPELECNIMECRTLKLCKICEGSTDKGEKHQCQNLITCKVCKIVHSSKVKHKCVKTSNSEKCKSCSKVMIDKKTHKCPVFKTCEFCNKKFDENDLHQCAANQCVNCKYIVPYDEVKTHKCADMTVCILCKTAVTKSKLDVHKCMPLLRCQICQFPMSSDTKHTCKTCPYCNAIFTKSHVCFSDSSKNKSNSTINKSVPKPVQKMPENKSKHTYTCSSCSMTTKLKTEFLKHSCVKKVDEVFLCNGCPKMFSKREFLEKHQATMCPKKKCTPCSKCGISLTDDMVKTHTCAIKLLQAAQKGVAQSFDRPKKVVTIATPKENLLQEQNQNVPPVKATVSINRGANVPEKVFSVNATVPASTKAIIKKLPNKSNQPQLVKISAASTPKPLPKNVKENVSSSILEPPTISASDFETLVTSVAGETIVDTSSIFSSPPKREYLSLPSLDDDTLQFSDAIVEVNSTNDPLTWEEFRAEISYN